jgi:pantetheine hydrolase
MRFWGLLFLAAAACSHGRYRLVADGPADHESFRAAAIHMKSFNGSRGSREEADEVFRINYEATKPLVRMAAEAGAKVIVTPEYSNTGIQIARGSRPFVSTPLPDAPTSGPVWETETAGMHPLVEDFARLAAEVDAYIVTDFLERDGEDDDARYYNTMIVLDPEGRLLAKYRKINLYMFENLIESRGDEVVSFDTPYGRFGMLLCLDPLSPWTWRRLVNEHRVDFLVAQTLWEPTPIFHGRHAMNLLAAMSGVPVIWANQRRLAFAGGAGIIRPGEDDTALDWYNPAGVAVANLPLPDRCRAVARVPGPPAAIANR